MKKIPALLLLLFVAFRCSAQTDSARFHLYAMRLGAGTVNASFFSGSREASNALFNGLAIYDKPKPGFISGSLQAPNQAIISGQAEFRKTTTSRYRLTAGFSYISKGAFSMTESKTATYLLPDKNDQTGFTFKGDSVVYEKYTYQWKHSSAAANVGYIYSIMPAGNFNVYAGANLHFGVHYGVTQSASYDFTSERTYEPVPVDSINYIPPGYYYKYEKNETTVQPGFGALFIRIGIPIGGEFHFADPRRRIGFFLEMAPGAELTIGANGATVAKRFQSAQAGIHYRFD